MASTSRRPVAAPSPRLLLLEQRALFELGALAAAAPWLRAVGRGDRHPVLVLPGFTASDRTTTLLRMQLRTWGYWAHGWNLGRNWGPTPEVVEGIVERLHDLHRRHEQKVTLVGWSLGGMYARELARQFPDEVRSVISLGSPYRMEQIDRSALSPVVDRLLPTFERRLPDAEWVPEDAKPRLTVPATSIYSRTDGIVRWHLCIDRVTPTAENIEVRGSHTGLAVNPAVLYAIGDRLAQPADDWRPFHAPAPLRRFFPKPADWSPTGVAAPR
jgi:pimeloyl-ACP methyl ester carboxylesterase